MSEPSFDVQKYTEVFSPHVATRQTNMKKTNGRLVHYCSAEAAVGILTKKKFWMRNSKCMNDFQEIDYGFESIRKAWGRKEEQTPIKRILNQAFPDITDKVEQLFDSWHPHVNWGTYISCFSEHDASEDTLGRLSMWRGYGGDKTGVAIVMNNAPFFNEDDSFNGVYSSPVEYTDNKGVRQTLDGIANNILQDMNFVQSLGADIVQDTIFRLLKFMMICTKHPGFIEEREWRVIYCPALEKNENITKDIEIIGGVPQEVYKIPLKSNADDSGIGVIIPELLDRIIIGPTEHPIAICNAFVAILKEIGIPTPEGKVFASEIPLRV